MKYMESNGGLPHLIANVLTISIKPLKLKIKILYYIMET